MQFDMVIWSKDRPAQLDLLLRSYYAAGTPANTVRVVYTTSDPAYDYAYLEVMVLHPMVEFYEEKGFQNTLVDVIEMSTENYVLGNSDDNVFLRHVPILPEIEDTDCGISLRLHPGVTVCQPANLVISPAGVRYYDEDYCRCNWTQADPCGCWGYPCPVDSMVYRKNWFLDCVKKSGAVNPCTLEQFMNNRCRDSSRPDIVYFEDQCLVSVAANKIQRESNNPVYGTSTSDLLEAWRAGHQIRYSDFAGKQYNSCHIASGYVFEEGGQGHDCIVT